jgi:hypothetical protein
VLRGAGRAFCASAAASSIGARASRPTAAGIRARTSPSRPRRSSRQRKSS